MDAQISPEPTEEERAALMRALAEVDVGFAEPSAYRSPWRLAGLPGEEEPDA